MSGDVARLDSLGGDPSLAGPPSLWLAVSASKVRQWATARALRMRRTA
jgi:hypothetical protein